MLRVNGSVRRLRLDGGRDTLLDALRDELDEKLARSQVIGDTVMGLGMALLEETVFDPTGRIANATFGDYLVPAHADVPDLDVVFVGTPVGHARCGNGELVGPMTGEPTPHAREPTSNGEEPTPRGSGPVAFAYDGSELAKLAIEQAGKLLGTGRDALVLTVWKPFDVGFVPAAGLRFDAADVNEVRQAAEQTAAEGASLAESVGFRVRSLAVESASTWKGIVDLADDRGASLIVLGSHGRTGPARVLIGSVAEAVAAHSRRSVLITHGRS